MSSRDLVSLADLKKWLGISTTDSDFALGTLISQISGFVYNKTSRGFILPRTNTELYDGNGGQMMLLLNWPVNSLQSLMVNGVVVSPAPSDTADGWILEDAPDDPPGLMQRLYLRGGYRFTTGVRNVRVTYSAGYQVTDEAMTVIGSGTQRPGEAYGKWGSSVSVLRASNRTPLTQVASAPAAGQFSVSNGDYTFSAADAGLPVLVTYGYVPYDLAQAVMEWAAERYRYKDRIGIQSKSLGGAETMSYALDAVPKYVAQVIQTYTRVIS